ncbi:hypothetical protein [Asanoa sp. NPDC050611]|uniref:DUF7737 domain-containing protein n=1 Tax=Asanoa sp. NPDC050611 TaxID=3157098 RepID=UPI00340489A9
MFEAVKDDLEAELEAWSGLMEPDDAYLCIVASHRPTRVALPFDDDPTLSVILSKALLLAADDKITDWTILNQINRP